MCLIGEPNSGKTSLFTPISRLIPARYTAMISKQKAFNKSLVDENTQIIFLDEAQYTKLMDPDNWKILTQGGLTAHDRKYKTSSLAVIRCPMFITSQTDMDFGGEHNTAMDARLRKFFIRSLTSPRVEGVRANAMDCIIWACGLARTPEDELPPPMPGTSLQPEEIDEEEKYRIRTIQLDESESEHEGSEQEEPNTDTEDSAEEGEIEDTNSTCLEKSLEKIASLREQQPCHSLKQRQLVLLATEVKRTVDERDSREECARLRVLEETKERWISLRMIREENAHLLESVNGPYHPNIERSREEYVAKKRQEDNRILEKKAREYLNDQWVMEKEKEL